MAAAYNSWGKGWLFPLFCIQFPLQELVHLGGSQEMFVELENNPQLDASLERFSKSAFKFRCRYTKQRLTPLKDVRESL